MWARMQALHAHTSTSPMHAKKMEEKRRNEMKRNVWIIDTSILYLEISPSKEREHSGYNTCTMFANILYAHVLLCKHLTLAGWNIWMQLHGLAFICSRQSVVHVFIQRRQNNWQKISFNMRNAKAWRMDLNSGCFLCKQTVIWRPCFAKQSTTKTNPFKILNISNIFVHFMMEYHVERKSVGIYRIISEKINWAACGTAKLQNECKRTGNGL